jgi:hypothetical protein
MARMDRLYKALVWLASIAIVLGLVIVYHYVMLPVGGFSQGYFFSGSDGPVVAFFSMLKSQTFYLFSTLSNLFDSGAIVLGIALAWANRRYGWMAALIIVTLLSFIWPTFVLTWQNFHVPPSQDPSQSQAQIQMSNLMVLSVSLLPAALALIFALIHRKAAAANTAATADADLGVVRSAL